MTCIGCVSCISGLAIVGLVRLWELSACFRESDSLRGRGVVHLPFFVSSVVAILDCVCSLAMVDWPTVSLLEIVAKVSE